MVRRNDDDSVEYIGTKVGTKKKGGRPLFLAPNKLSLISRFVTHFSFPYGTPHRNTQTVAHQVAHMVAHDTSRYSAY